MEAGFVEVFPPRSPGSRPPVLLSTLEAQLLQAKGAASRMACAGQQPGSKRDPGLAANLHLDVHRQALQTFIDGFSEAYAPLLSRVKAVLDSEIQQGLCDALHNGELRQQLLADARQQAAAKAAVRARVLEGRQQQRQALYDATAAAQARLAAAQRAHAAVTRDLAEAGLAQERVHAAVEAARARQQRLASALAADAAWLGARPHATALLALEAGPLTPQEAEELEGELGVPLEAAPAGQHPLEQALTLLHKHDAAAAAKLLEAQMTGAGTSRRQALYSQQQAASAAAAAAGAATAAAAAGAGGGGGDDGAQHEEAAGVWSDGGDEGQECHE